MPESDVVLVNAAARQQFSDAQFINLNLWDGDAFFGRLLCFKKGQQVPVHLHEHKDECFDVIEGEESPMTLQEQLDQDLHEAMRAKDLNRITAIRMLKAAISNLEFSRTDPKNPQHGQPVTEGDLLRVVENQIKQRREAIELYLKGNRPELAAKEEAEIQALSKYRPSQLGRTEIKTEVECIMAELNTREFPKVMREAASRLKGRADGKLINEVVRELTS